MSTKNEELKKGLAIIREATKIREKNLELQVQINYLREQLRKHRKPRKIVVKMT